MILFCPIHMLESMACNQGCAEARREAAQLSEALAEHWRSPDARRRLAEGRMQAEHVEHARAA